MCRICAVFFLLLVKALFLWIAVLREDVVSFRERENRHMLIGVFGNYSAFLNMDGIM